jgi:predicted small lipoprotein YifL
MKRAVDTLIVMACVVAITGCGRSSPAPQYQFERASQSQVETLKFIQEEDKRIADTVYAVKSEHHENAWYVSTKIYGPGLEDGVSAVWLMVGDKNSSGMILAVDGTANEFTPVPYMNDTQAGSGLGMDAEAEALEAYVQDNVK